MGEIRIWHVKGLRVGQCQRKGHLVLVGTDQGDSALVLTELFGVNGASTLLLVSALALTRGRAFITVV